MVYEQSTAVPVQIPYNCVQLIVELKMYRIMCVLSVGTPGSNKYGGVRVDVYTLLYVPRREQLPRNRSGGNRVVPGSRLPPRCVFSINSSRAVCESVFRPPGSLRGTLGFMECRLTQNGAIHGDASRDPSRSQESP